MDLLRHAWLFLLSMAPLNVLFWWLRARPFLREHPELRAGYRRLLGWTGLWLSLPWLVMGAGCELGGVPFFVLFLSLTAGGPFAWAFWAVLYGQFLFLLYWAVRGGGAEVLVRYPPLFAPRAESPEQMRRQLVGFAVFALVWNTVVLVWLNSQ